jgi:formylglycine-generating enzyme required for sulfatase activity
MVNVFAPYFRAFRTVHVCAILCAMTSGLLAADPAVSNISAVQRAGTGLVDISYNLSASTPRVTISLRVSSDGGATFDVPAVSLSGDIGPAIRIGNSKRITWNAGADWPEKWSNAMRFEISADDGIVSPPVIKTLPASQTIVSGSTAVLTVAASGTNPLTYQWYEGSVGTTTKPVGSNAASFTTPVLTATTSYWVRLSNTAGSVNSALATVSCLAITSQPASKTISSGSSVTLAVSASGVTPMTYQWYEGPVGTTSKPVGTNSASFTSPALTGTTRYWVRVGNATVSLNSALATISCSPTITAQPASQTITAGSSVSFSVTASGPTPMTYQWYEGPVGTTTKPVGANSASFTTASSTDNATYWVRVSNTAGSVDSNLVIVSVRPSISTQPASATIDAGGTSLLTVVASGPSLSYQWFRGAVGVTTSLVGTNSASFTTPALNDTATYWVRVSNTAGSANSDLATIAVRPSITSQPGSQSINSGTATTLAVTAVGSTPLTYQWYQGAVGTTTTPVGTNSSTFTTPVLTTTASYWVRISNASGTVNSSGATVTMNAAPRIITQPSSIAITRGDATTLNVVVSGTAPLRFEWYEGAAGTFTKRVGTNSSSFTTPALITTTSYWVRVLNSSGVVNSATATVTVNLPPTITTQPASVTIASGDTTTLRVVASGTGPLSYQWYQGTAGTTTTPVGTNSSSFTPPALTSTTSFWVRVSIISGSVNSIAATVTVKVVPAGFAYIPSGISWMGSSETTSNAPFTKVNVSEFFMSKYEVTKAQWDDVRTWGVSNGYNDLSNGGGKASNHPVHTISWFDMVKWCNACSEKNGLTPVYTVNGTVMKTGTAEPAMKLNANGYRLPTEAEWEKAARGGRGGWFPHGALTISHGDANYFSDPYYGYDSSGAVNNYHPTYATGSIPYTSPVGSFEANGYGLYDMAGNIYEYCWDWYEASTYSTYLSMPTDPLGPLTGSYRVKRGGSWNGGAIGCRTADRSFGTPSFTSNFSGFRVARTLVP